LCPDIKRVPASRLSRVNHKNHVMPPRHLAIFLNWLNDPADIRGVSHNHQPSLPGYRFFNITEIIGRFVQELTV